MKPDHHTPCGGCGAKDLWFLHSVRHRASFRRFCTNCVLKNHQGLFCPICLEVFDEPPPNQRLICLKCPSICHLTCPSQFSSTSSFVCPVCHNPSFTFFNINPNKKLKSGSGSQGGSANASDNGEEKRVIDKDAAKALLAAAKLAAVSMTRAANLARADAEKRVKEATLAKKKAKEALERVAFLAAKESGKEDGKDKEPKGTAKGPVVSKPKADAEAQPKRNGLSVQSVEEKEANGLHSGSPVNTPKSANGMQN